MARQPPMPWDVVVAVVVVQLVLRGVVVVVVGVFVDRARFGIVDHIHIEFAFEDPTRCERDMQSAPLPKEGLLHHHHHDDDEYLVHEW